MKDIINIIDSETRAMAFVQMELSKKLETEKTYTKNAQKLKEILKQHLNAMMDACASMREVVTKLQALDEFELLHGADLDELLNGEK